MSLPEICAQVGIRTRKALFNPAAAAQVGFGAAK
jgi:hypothetical protein